MLTLSALVTVALAEPPPYEPLEEVVARADLVIVGTAERIYFQALKPGESLKSNSHADYWMEYRVDDVLFGEAPVAKGETLRITFDPGGCEMYDFVIRRDGDTFVETMVGSERTLDAAAWLPDGPQLLVLDLAPDGSVRHEVHWVSPEAATREARATMRRLLEERQEPAR
jgi:hypothetical protein